MQVMTLTMQGIPRSTQLGRPRQTGEIRPSGGRHLRSTASGSSNLHNSRMTRVIQRGPQARKVYDRMNSSVCLGHYCWFSEVVSIYPAGFRTRPAPRRADRLHRSQVLGQRLRLPQGAAGTGGPPAYAGHPQGRLDPDEHYGRQCRHHSRVVMLGGRAPRGMHPGIRTSVSLLSSPSLQAPLVELASFTGVYNVGTASSLVPVSSIPHESAGFAIILLLTLDRPLLPTTSGTSACIESSAA